jgi:hypothetical protein
VYFRSLAAELLALQFGGSGGDGGGDDDPSSDGGGGEDYTDFLLRLRADGIFLPCVFAKVAAVVTAATAAAPTATPDKTAAGSSSGGRISTAECADVAEAMRLAAAVLDADGGAEAPAGLDVPGLTRLVMYTVAAVGRSLARAATAAGVSGGHGGGVGGGAAVVAVGGVAETTSKLKSETETATETETETARDAELELAEAALTLVGSLLLLDTAAAATTVASAVRAGAVTDCGDGSSGVEGQAGLDLAAVCTVLPDLFGGRGRNSPAGVVAACRCFTALADKAGQHPAINVAGCVL